MDEIGTAIMTRMARLAGVATIALMLSLTLGLIASAAARAPGEEAPATDSAAREAVVRHCAEIYHASGHPCACPSDPMRNGQACGRRSAHDKPGGAPPVCSADEVTAELLSSPAEVEDRCHYRGR